MQLSAVPVIFSLQNVKQALLTTTTNPAGCVTQSVVLTIANGDKAEKAIQASADGAKKPLAILEAPDSPPTVAVGQDSPPQIASRAVTSLAAMRALQQVQRPGVQPVKRLANVSLVKNVPGLTNAARLAGFLSGGRPVGRLTPVNAVPVMTLTEERMKRQAASPSTSAAAAAAALPERGRVRLLTESEVKDYYKTAPLKKRPLIFHREAESSGEEEEEEEEEERTQGKKAEERKKAERSKGRPKRKPKNEEVRKAEKFVMVNRDVLAGLMDHVRSNEEPIEEKELARRFQKDRVKKCDYCDRTFNYFSKLVEHIRSHTKIRPYVCRICSSRFKYKGDLMVHIKQHSEDKPFECDCGRRFATKKYLNVHIRQATIMGRHPAARPFSRRQENVKAVNGGGGRASGSRQVSDESEYWLFECQECGKRFTSKVSLLEHVRKHTKLEPVFECNSCRIKFEDSQHFERHMLEHN